MKAIRVHEFGGPEVMRLEEVADPKPGRGELAVRIRAVGVNPVDTYVRSGAYPKKPALPYTPGSDAAGEVVSVGPEVKQFKPGDRVYLFGTSTGAYAEQALCAEAQAHPLPARASFPQGAAMGTPYGTAFRAMFQLGHALPGETVLVHGASGGVGLAAVQMARAAGLTIIGTAGTEPGKKLVAEQGAHHVLDHHDPGYFDQILQLTAGRGVDLIMEMLANQNLARDLTLLAMRGRVLVIGNRGTIEINPRDAMSRDAQIIGMTMFNVGPEDMARLHAGLVAGLDAGTLRPVIGQELKLSDAARAHQEVMKPSGAYGKIVLVP